MSHTHTRVLTHTHISSGRIGIRWPLQKVVGFGVELAPNRWIRHPDRHQTGKYVHQDAWSFVNWSGLRLRHRLPRVADPLQKTEKKTTRVVIPLVVFFKFFGGVCQKIMGKFRFLAAILEPEWSKKFLSRHAKWRPLIGESSRSRRWCLNGFRWNILPVKNSWVEYEMTPADWLKSCEVSIDVPTGFVRTFTLSQLHQHHPNSHSRFYRN